MSDPDFSVKIIESGINPAWIGVIGTLLGVIGGIAGQWFMSAYNQKRELEKTIYDKKYKIYSMIYDYIFDISLESKFKSKDQREYEMAKLNTMIQTNLFIPEETKNILFKIASHHYQEFLNSTQLEEIRKLFLKDLHIK